MTDLPQSCLSCRIVQGVTSTHGGVILETELFHAHQDFAYPIPGMVILASRRHFRHLHELTPEELTQFTELFYRIRKAQAEALGVETVYYFYNEDTTHHFHIWMMPRYEWMYAFGRSVESVRPALKYAQAHLKSDDHLKIVQMAAQKLRERLNL